MRQTSEIDPQVWGVITKVWLRDYGLCLRLTDKKLIEQGSEVYNFDGGCFLVLKNEIDCYVIPEKKGKWATKGLLRKVVGGTIEKHGSARVKCHKSNTESWNFAKRLGFKVIDRIGDFVVLECKSWEV